jgi:hypothetical protein
MNMDQRGWAPVSVKPETWRRLDKLAIVKDETMNSIISRLLDDWEKNHGSVTK